MLRVVLVACFVAAVAAQFAAPDANGFFPAPFQSSPSEGRVFGGASELWRKSDADVGKVIDIEVGPNEKIVLGSAYHGRRISVLDLFSGAIESHATPGDLDAYSVEAAATGQIVAFGCPATGLTGCTLFSWSNMNISQPVQWQKVIPGQLYFSQHALKLSDDGKVVATTTLDEKPSKHVPVPGKLHWANAADGVQKGEIALTKTLGEIWLDLDLGTNVATRQFASGLDGDLEIYSTSTGAKVVSIPDRFARLGFTPNLAHVALPQLHREGAFDMHSATTGAIEWEYIPPVGEYNNAIVVGRGLVIGSWFKNTAPAFTIRAFAISQPTKQGNPSVSFNIALPHTAQPHDVFFEVSDDAATSDLAFAVHGVGIFYAPLTTASPSPTLVFSHPDPCGFHSLKVIRTASKGTVIVAAVNKMVSGQCSFSANTLAVSV